jgi:hypothetical protein
MNEVGYVLSNRHLYFFVNEIIKSGDPTVQLGILTGIIQDLKPEHYRDVLRAVVKAVYVSGDQAGAGRLSRSIVQGSDYINAQNRRTSGIQDLETRVGFISVALQKQGHDIEGVTLVKK